MKIRTTVAATFVLLIATAGIALAGAKNSGEVVVFPDHSFANGGMGGARNSDNAIESIGCNVTGFRRSAPVVECWARDRNGNDAMCVSRDPSLASVAATLTSDSYIRFDWDKGGECTALTVNNSSSYEPKR